MNFDYETSQGKNTVYLSDEKRQNLEVGLDSYVIVNSTKTAKVAQSETDTVKVSRDIASNITTDQISIERVPSARELILSYDTVITVKNVSTQFKQNLIGETIPTDEPFETTFTHADVENKTQFKVEHADPQKPLVVVTEDTSIEFIEESIEESSVSQDNRAQKDSITFDDIGGLDDEIEKFREVTQLPINQPALFEQTDLDMYTGILLQGPPGTGKSMLARALINQLEDTKYIPVEAPELIGKRQGEGSENVRLIFEEAQENAPAIIFIDEIDAVAQKRGNRMNKSTNTIVAQLLNSMDGLDSDDDVTVIGATNRVDDLDPALRRGGRFDKEINVGVPDRNGRKEIIELYAEKVPTDDSFEIEPIVENTHGFVGADIASLFREAFMNAINRNNISYKKETSPPDIVVSNTDVQNAITSIEPNGLREFTVELPDVSWDDVGGLDDTKHELRKNIILPIDNKDIYEKYDANPASGFLLYGPTGTGKTLLAKAIANETNSNFISVKGPELISKWVGEPEQEIRNVFHKARQNSPAIIFFDEIDAIAKSRSQSSSSHNMTERVVDQLLTELDGLGDTGEDVTVIGATNKIDDIDEAIKRAGRLGNQHKIGVPDAQARLEIFEIHIKDDLLADSVNISNLVEQTDGYVGADIEKIVQRATLKAVDREIQTGTEQTITHDDFLEAIEETDPSI
jgi:transitional endoplasmic reticulum ATPase